MSLKLISIIIPVYNAEKYLQRCVYSVLKQTYQNFEIILVDDGSTDLSGIMCDNFAYMDKRIISSHKRNGGAASARNKGIQITNGDYIVFIDSDDMVSPYYLSNLCKYLSDDPDYAETSVIEVKNGKELKNTYKEKKMNNVLEYINSNDFQNTGPYCKLFKKQIIKDYNIKFPESVNIGEDAVFLFTYLKYVQNPVYINWGEDYYYCINSKSLMNTKFPLESDWNDYCVMRDSAIKMCKYVGLSIYNKNVWNLLSSRLRMYIKHCCIVDHTVIYLKMIPKIDTSHYGFCYNRSFAGNVFRFLIRYRLFVLINIMVKFSIKSKK